MNMNRLMILALAAAALAAPAALAAQTAQPAKPATAIALTCDAGAATAGGEALNLHGHWDFLMVPRGTPSFGLMSIGFVGADYGGSLAPARTAPVVLRKIALTGNAIHMVVASTEGDVLFDGRLSAKGDLMCGTVTYHGGETFPMIAQKRPSSYQSQPQAQRAR
jgi:peptidoglycan/LPS O-acetylase OafA/YrhL